MDFANPQIFVPAKLDGKESVVIFVFLDQVVIMDIAIQNLNVYVKMVGQEHCVINVRYTVHAPPSSAASLAARRGGYRRRRSPRGPC